MNTQLTTTIEYHKPNYQRVEEDYNAGQIYPFQQGRHDEWASPFEETTLRVYNEEEQSFRLWDGNHRNLQQQLERREEFFREISKLEEQGADISLYFEIADYEGEVIPAEEFISLSEKVERVDNLEDWAERIADENQKDWKLGVEILSAIDLNKFIEGLLKLKKLTALETSNGWILYPNR